MKKVMIVYESETGATEAIARVIEEQLRAAGIAVESKSISKAKEEGYDLIGALRGADAVIVGSPTHHGWPLDSVKSFLADMSRANTWGRIGAAFGSYGWSGEAVEIITDTLKSVLNMEVIEPGLKVKGSPDESSLRECEEFGKTVADIISRRG